MASLDEYRRKRDFAKTAEPSGGGAGARKPSAGRGRGQSESDGGLSFVVHKHAARRLHYDLRLELEGVLLSWAVPKGPSLDPTDKRLAMHVEDHPLDYAPFEGTIPPGEYGAGAVIVWDRGTWRPLDEGPAEARAALEEGTLKFELAGEKLAGAWMLVRMKPRPGESGEAWLLIKERDAHARPRDEYDVLDARPESVASGRTVEEVASAGAGAAGSRTEPPGPAPAPADVPVQLATLSAAPPTGTRWLHEVKYDGYRLRIALAGGGARVLTRGGEEWTDRFPELAAAARNLPATDALLDGEAVVFGEHGVPDFGALQDALSTGDSSRIIYLAFDVLHLDGRDLRGEPLLERKRLLGELLGSAGPDSPLRFADHVEGRGTDFLAAACSLGLEGAISKRADAPYRPGRTSDWRKTRCAHRQEFVVAGATAPRGSRRGFGALLLGVYTDEGELAYAGRVGSGFRERDLEVIGRLLVQLETSDPPLADPPSIPGRSIRWVRPELVVEVEFAEWTAAGLLRQPRFLGMREDRDPRTVRREEPAQSTETAPVPTPAPRTARLTSPNKALFPAGDTPGSSAVTKADLAAYYREVAPAMLPHLAGRPLSVVRCPHGRTGECFFQKHPDRGFPRQLHTLDVVERSGESAIYFYLDDADGLIALVQLGVLEIHAWNSVHTAPDTPDRIVFDLDPGPGVEPDEVRAAAFTVRDTLAELGLTGFVKTTGGHGLHVVAPIVPDPAHDYDTVRAFAREVVDHLAAAEPERFTARMAKSARPGRIFVDYLRNAHGATAIAAYSTRARPGAPVAVPLTWEELAEEFSPLALDVHTVPERLTALDGADPWDGYEAARSPLSA